MKFSNVLGHWQSTLGGLLVGIMIAGPILQSFDFDHPSAAKIAGLAVAVATALYGAFYGKKSTDQGSGAAVPVLAFLFLMLMGPALMAQDAPAAASTDIQNMYAAGVSYNQGASPSIAGTALYAHKVADIGTYAFTAVDVLPNSYKPITVNTNIGVGVAQKLATIANVPVYIPTAAGISFNGTNTGWQWNTGVLASVHIKGSYYLMPSVRVVKSSVSNGTGYQPIFGVMFGWGK